MIAILSFDRQFQEYIFTPITNVDVVFDYLQFIQHISSILWFIPAKIHKV